MAGIKHGDSYEGLSQKEIDAVLAEADEMVVWIASKGKEDALFMGRLVRTLLYTAVHISNFTGLPGRWGVVRKGGDRRWLPPVERLSSKMIQDREDDDGKLVTFLVYRRVKKLEDNVVHMPVSKEIKPWLKEFLDAPRPTHRSRYNQLLKQLQDQLSQKGRNIHLNPHRLRHTCMWLLSQEMNVPMENIERITGTTQQTLNRYARRTVVQIGSDLRDGGW